MHAEIDSIQSDGAALTWAIGCVVASYTQRYETMPLHIPPISRGILALEMFVCFFPLTLMFAALLSRGVIGFAGPLPFDAWYVSMLFATLIGPLGFVTAISVLALRRTRINRFVLIVMAASGAWVLGGYLRSLGAPTWIEHWRDIVLLGLLPVVGALHLVVLASHNRRTVDAAPRSPEALIP